MLKFPFFIINNLACHSKPNHGVIMTEHIVIMINFIINGNKFILFAATLIQVYTDAPIFLYYRFGTLLSFCN